MRDGLGRDPGGQICEFRVFPVFGNVGVSAEARQRQRLAHSRYMTDGNEWLGTEEAARQLGMTPDWVRDQISAGRLKARTWMTGRRSTIGIRRVDLDEFIRRHSSG